MKLIRNYFSYYENLLVATISKRVKLNIVFVGAAGGSNKRWEDLEHLINSIGVDGAFSTLLDDQKRFGSFASDVPGERYFCKTAKPDCSSLMKPNVGFLNRFKGWERFEVNETQKVKCTTLDIVLEGSIPNFMCIDIQGGSWPP